MKALIFGSYDPLTLGDLDFIKRVSEIFAEVIICVIDKESSEPWFSTEQRMCWLSYYLNEKRELNIKIISGKEKNELKQIDDIVVIKEMRDGYGQNSYHDKAVYRALNLKWETLYLAIDSRYTHVDEDVVKQIAVFNGPLSSFVPEGIISSLTAIANIKNI